MKPLCGRQQIKGPMVQMFYFYGLPGGYLPYLKTKTKTPLVATHDNHFFCLCTINSRLANGKRIRQRHRHSHRWRRRESVWRYTPRCRIPIPTQNILPLNTQPDIASAVTIYHFAQDSTND